MKDPGTYADRIAWYDEKISNQIEALEKLGDMLAEVDRKVKVNTLNWCHDNQDISKKLGMERAEMAAAITEQAKCDYYEVCYLRLKVKIAEKVIDATQSGMSGVQSMMKYDSGGR